MEHGALPKLINVGCGYDKRPGYLNVDMDPHCSPDILVTDIEFSNLPKGWFEGLISYDVLEHIRRADTPGALLEWADLLQLNGTMELETSNVMAIVDLMREQQSYQMHAAYTVFMFGNQAHDGDYHHTGFTDRTLKVQILAAGFDIEQFEERDRWLYWLKAKKTYRWSALLDQELSDTDFIVEAWRAALERDPEPEYVNGLKNWLETGEKTRRNILKHLHDSEERRLLMAGRYGL